MKPVLFIPRDNARFDKKPIAASCWRPLQDVPPRDGLRGRRGVRGRRLAGRVSHLRNRFIGELLKKAGWGRF